MAKKHFKQLKEKDFKMIKALSEAGFPTGKVADISGRSTTTVGYVIKSNSFESYQKGVTARNSKNRKPQGLNNLAGGGPVLEKNLTLDNINQKLDDILTLLRG